MLPILREVYLFNMMNFSICSSGGADVRRGAAAHWRPEYARWRHNEFARTQPIGKNTKATQEGQRVRGGGASLLG